MGAGHSHALYVHEHSVVHRMAPQAKLVAALGMVVSIAITPREAVWAFGIYAVDIVGLTRMSRIRAGFVAVRLFGILVDGVTPMQLRELRNEGLSWLLLVVSLVTYPRQK